MPFNSGAMIALVVPDPENYAISPPTENSLDASDLHITLAYLGEASEISAPEREAILEACQVLADTSDAPESLFPASTGVFPPDPESPDTEENPKAAYYAAPSNSERFSALREEIMVHLSARGVSHFVSTKHPVFTPHVTLTYESMETPPELNLPTPVPVKFPNLIVRFGEEVHTFTLRSEGEGPALPLTASVRHKISSLSASGRYSEEYVTAIYLRQTHVTASAAQTRAQSALDATARALGLDEMTSPLARVHTLLNRSRMASSPESKVYFASRALALASKTKPQSTTEARNLSAMTASIQSLIADGNSSAARSARARAQLRDRYGRWIFMGGSIRFKISMAGTPGGGRWVHGIARGVDMATGEVQVELEDGTMVSVPANKVEQTKATLGEKIAGKYRAFRPRSEGKAGDATTEKERAKAERTENVDAADDEAFPAIERLMASTSDVAAGGNPKGNHVITLMSNNADEIKRASLAGEETVDVTGSRAPFRDVTVPVSTSDAMAVINDLDARRILPEDYESLDDTEKARAYGAAQGRAIAALSGRFNDRDDAEASELRRAPGMRNEDIREITEGDLTEAEPQSFSADELASLVNDAMDKLNEKVDGTGPMVPARDQIGAAVAQANSRFRANDISEEEYLNSLDAIKEFAYAQGGAGNSDSDAFDAFSEDIDNIHAAAGGSDDIDRVKAMFNAIESDNLFAGDLDDEFGLVSDFNNHMNEIREKIGLGTYLGDPAALAGDLEDFKNHFNADSQGDPISSQIDPDISSKVAEDLDESIAALRGERTGEAYDSSGEEDPGLGDVADTDTDTDADFPEYQASTPEVQEAINEGSALYDVLWEDFPDGILEDDFPGSTDFFDPMGEFFSPDFEETPENFRQLRDKIDAFDPAVFNESKYFQQPFNEQKDKFVAALDKAADSLTSAEEAPESSDDSVDAPEFAEDAAKISAGLKEILTDEDYSPSTSLRDAVNDLANIAANVGLDTDSGKITPEEGADILDAAREDFMNLYGDEELGDELNAAGIGEDLEDFLDNDYNDFSQALRNAGAAQEVQDDDSQRADSPTEGGVPEADGTGPGDSGEPADSVGDGQEWPTEVEDRKRLDAWVERMGGGPYAGFTAELIPPRTKEQDLASMRDAFSLHLSGEELERVLEHASENWTQQRANIRMFNPDLNVAIGISPVSHIAFSEREVKHVLDSLERPVMAVRAGGDEDTISINLVTKSETAPEDEDAAAYYIPSIDQVTFIREHLELDGGRPTTLLAPSFEEFGFEHYVTHELGHLVDFRARNNGYGYMSLFRENGLEGELNDSASTEFFTEIFSEDGLVDALGGSNIYAASQPVEAYADMFAYFHLLGGSDSPLRDETWDRISQRYADKYGWIRAADAEAAPESTPESTPEAEAPESGGDVLPDGLSDTPDDDLIGDLAPEIAEDKQRADEALRELRRRLAEPDSTPEDVYDAVRDAQDAFNRYGDKVEDALDSAEEGSDKEALLDGEGFRAENASNDLDDVLPDLDEAPVADDPIPEDTITQAINDLRDLNNPLANAQADIFEAMRENGMPITAEQIRQMRDMLGGITSTPDSTDDDRAMGTVTDRVLDSIPDTSTDDDFDPTEMYRTAIDNAGGNPRMRKQIRDEIDADSALTDVERRNLYELLDGTGQPEEVAPDLPEGADDDFGVDDFNVWRDAILNFNPDGSKTFDDLRAEIEEDIYITDAQREELYRLIDEQPTPQPTPEDADEQPEPDSAPEGQPSDAPEAADEPEAPPADEAQNNDLENAFDEMMGAFDAVAEGTNADLYNEYIDNGINENNQDRFIDAAKRLLGNDHPAVARVEELLGRRNEEQAPEAPEAPEAADEPEAQPTPPEEPEALSDDEIGYGQHTPLSPAQRSAVENAIALAESRNVPRAAELLADALEKHDNGEIPDYKLIAALGMTGHMIKPVDSDRGYSARELNILANIKEVQARLQLNMARADNDPNLPELSWDNLAAQMESNEGGLLDSIDDVEISEWLDRIKKMTVSGERKRFELLPDVDRANQLIKDAEEAFDGGDRERAQELLREAVDSFDAAIDNRRNINMNDAFKRSLERRRRATEALSARMDERIPRITQGGRSYYIKGTYNRNLEETFAIGGRGRDNAEVREARVGDSVMRVHGDNYGQRGVIVGFKGERGIDKSTYVEVLVYDEGRQGGAGYRILAVSMNTVKKLDESLTNDSMSDEEITEMLKDVERSRKTLGQHLQEDVAAAVRRNRDLDRETSDQGMESPAEPQRMTPEEARESAYNFDVPDSSEGWAQPEPESAPEPTPEERVQNWINSGWGELVPGMIYAAENIPNAADLLDPDLDERQKNDLAKQIVGFDTGETFGSNGYTLTATSVHHSTGPNYFRRYDGSTVYTVSGRIMDSFGDRIGELQRVIEVSKTPDGKTKIHVHNSLMDFPEDSNKGSGFAKDLNGRMEAWAAANHTDDASGPEFTINATLDNGGYVWTKFGFRFQKQDDADRFISKLEEMASPNSIEAAQVEELFKARERGEEILPIDIMMVGFRLGMSDKNNDVWLGKKLLNGRGWEGVKDIRPHTLETQYRRRSDAERAESQTPDEQLRNPLFQFNADDYRDNETEFVLDQLRALDSNRSEAQKYRPRDWAAINNLVMNGGSVAGLNSTLRERLHNDIKNVLNRNRMDAGAILYDINRAFFKHKYSDRPAPSDLGVGDVLRNLERMTPDEARDSDVPIERQLRMESKSLGSYFIVLPEGFSSGSNQNRGVNGETAILTHDETGQKFIFKVDEYRRGMPLDGIEHNPDIEQGVNTLLREAGYVGVNYVATYEGDNNVGSQFPVVIQAMAGEHLGLDSPAVNRMFSAYDDPSDLEDPTQYIDMLALDLITGHSDRHDGNSMIASVGGENILIPIDNTLLHVTDQRLDYADTSGVFEWVSEQLRRGDRGAYSAALLLKNRLGSVGFKNLMKRSIREYAEALERSRGNYAAPDFADALGVTIDMIEENIDSILNALR